MNLYSCTLLQVYKRSKFVQNSRPSLMALFPLLFAENTDIPFAIAWLHIHHNTDAPTSVPVQVTTPTDAPTSVPVQVTKPLLVFDQSLLSHT